MEDSTMLATGLLNFSIRNTIENNIENQKCFCCGRKAEYLITFVDEKIVIGWCQSGHKGINYIVCKKCYKLQIGLNDFIFLLVRFLRKTILRGI